MTSTTGQEADTGRWVVMTPNDRQVGPVYATRDDALLARDLYVSEPGRDDADARVEPAARHLPAGWTTEQGPFGDFFTRDLDPDGVRLVYAHPNHREVEAVTPGPLTPDESRLVAAALLEAAALAEGCTCARRLLPTRWELRTIDPACTAHGSLDDQSGGAA